MLCKDDEMVHTLRMEPTEQTGTNDRVKQNWDSVYKRHFGKLTIDAARLNMQAFCRDDGYRELAFAWLNRDKQLVKILVGDVSKEERNAKVRIALTEVTRQLLEHDGTKRFRDMLPHPQP